MVVSNSDGMGTVEVKWNNFETNLSYSFKEIRECQDFLDVTLVSDEGEQVRAHKILLSACSPFFHTMLQRNPHENPLVYLKGVNLADLQSILEFIYNGEVNVHQSELNSFLEVAEDLQIKGLTDNINTDDLGGGGVVGGGGGGGVDDDRGVSPPPSQYPPFPLHHPSPLLNNPPPPHAIPTPPPSHLPPHLTPTPTAAVMSPPKKRKTTMTSCSPPPSSMTPPTIVVPSFSSSQQPSLGAVLASNAATTSHPTMPTPAFLTAAVAAENGGSVSDLPPPFKKSRLVGTDDEPKLDSDPDQKDNSTNTADVIVKPETPTPAAAATAGTPPLPALPSLPQHIVDSAPPPSVDASLLADDDEDACGGGDGEKDAFITLDQIKAAAAAGVTIGGAGDKGKRSKKKKGGVVVVEHITNGNDVDSTNNDSIIIEGYDPYASMPPTPLADVVNLDVELARFVVKAAGTGGNGGGGGYVCVECGKQCLDKSAARNHVEAKHVTTPGHRCPLCHKFVKTKNGLNNHMYRNHKKAAAAGSANNGASGGDAGNDTEGEGVVKETEIEMIVA